MAWGCQVGAAQLPQEAGAASPTRGWGPCGAAASNRTGRTGDRSGPTMTPSRALLRRGRLGRCIPAMAASRGSRRYSPREARWWFLLLRSSPPRTTMVRAAKLEHGGVGVPSCRPPVQMAVRKIKTEAAERAMLMIRAAPMSCSLGDVGNFLCWPGPRPAWVRPCRATEWRRCHGSVQRPGRRRWCRAASRSEQEGGGRWILDLRLKFY